MKNQQEILQKLKITQLNQMQLDAQKAIVENEEIVLLSPTGTGKTLAFLLPILAELDPTSEHIQTLILVPSRELAIQIEQVIREMGSGYKTNAVYGGRSGSRDKIDLQHTPAILIGTPGRVADHIRRSNINTRFIETLVLDEFDKSLEVGFKKEMKAIVSELPPFVKKVLTSATNKVEIPQFLGITKAVELNYLDQKEDLLKLQTIVSPSEDKLQSLLKLLCHIGDANGILFCNFKNTINTVSDFLKQHQIPHACFFGGLEQRDRERALIKFRNGTHRLLVATDLAARGIDVPELDFIIHYELPNRKEEFTHRNGRTARMHKNGIAYLLKWNNKNLPSFIEGDEKIKLLDNQAPTYSKWQTLYISGGRKDKISKGDIAGLFFKQGGLEKNELGVIELKSDCAFVAVPSLKATKLVAQLNNSRLKKKKVRISVLDE